MKNLAIKYPILGSSIDATKISLTVKSALGLIVIILVGLGVNQVDLTGITNDIVNAVELTLKLGAVLISIYGAGRKLLTKYKK